MNRSLAMVVVILGLFVVFGCAQRKIAQAPEQPAQPGIAAEDKQKAAPSGGTERESVTERQLPKTEQAEPQAAPKELAAKVQDIHFDYDKYDIRDDAKPVLKEIAGILSNNKKAKVVIEGYCDERGTDEYNLALGEKRAQSAKEYLVSLGIPSGRIDAVSYGEEKPLCNESTEACWAQNRRAHFVPVEGK